jgi:5-(aminomethyl)-3-furanmethanol phosphate kinase
MAARLAQRRVLRRAVADETPVEISVVVKVGGGLMTHPEHLDTTLTTIAAAASEVPLLVVPGGGAFADAIRDVDRRLGLSDDAAHWMAVLAMDQYGHLIASRLSNAALVVRPDDAVTLKHGQVPVLAPYQWLREADPVPHSWDVTSDSIAAWFAGALGARRLVLVKPAGADPAAPDVVDPYFSRALDGLAHSILPAHRVAELAGRLDRP